MRSSRREIVDPDTGQRYLGTVELPESLERGQVVDIDQVVKWVICDFEIDAVDGVTVVRVRRVRVPGAV
jgi:hypothetical protein